jgi:HSP20 family protein
VSVRDLIPWGRSSRQPPALFRDEDRNPFLSLHREVNRLFDDVFRGFGGGLANFGSSFGSSSGAAWPSVEVSETDREIRVTAEIPGLEEKDIEVLLTDGVLTLKGEKRCETEDKDRQFSERFYGRFERHVPLAAEVEEDKIDARFSNGVLSVVLPKNAKAQSHVRRIAVRS